MKWKYAFEGRIVPHNLGTYRYTVLFLPDAIASQLPFDKFPRLRFSGVLGAAAIHGAWQPCRGRWYCMLSKQVLKRSGYAMQDMALMRFRLEPQDSVAMPDELLACLEAQPPAAAAWKNLSAGKRRGFAHMVASAKRPETRGKRLEKLMELLLGGV